MMKTKKFLFELLGSVVVIATINFAFFPDNVGFLEAKPHPFWFPILLMAAFYGLTASLVTSAVYSLLYLGLFYHENILAIETFFSIRVLKQPVLFMLFGTLMGRMSQALKNSIEEWKTKYNAIKENKEELEKDLNAAKAVQNELEQRIVTQISTLSSVYDFAKRMGTFDIKQLYQQTLKTLIDNLQIEQASFYRAEHNLLIREETQFKEVLIYDPPKEVKKTKGVFKIAVETRKAVSIRDLFKELDFETLKSSPMICAPLFRKDGSLIGVITVDKIEFKKFTPTTLKLFGIVVEWLASAMDNALYVQETKNKSISDDVLGFYNYPYFEKRIQEEFDRAKRFSLPVCLLLFHIDNFKNIRRASKLPLLHALAAIFKNAIRDIDILSLYKQEDVWSVILPVFPEQETKKIQATITKTIQEFSFQPYTDEAKSLTFKMNIGTFTPKMENYKELLQMAEADFFTPAKEEKPTA